MLPLTCAPWVWVSPRVVSDETVLPEPGLADDAQRLPALHRVGDPVDGVHRPVLGRELDVEV